MSKTSALDKAIAQLDQDIRVLVMARDRLEVARTSAAEGHRGKPKAKRGPRAVPGTDAKQAS